MAQSIFDISENSRKQDQESIKNQVGLESSEVMTRLNLSMPQSAKDKFTKYCKEHYMTPSAQLRAWIDEFCE